MSKCNSWIRAVRSAGAQSRMSAGPRASAIRPSSAPVRAITRMSRSWAAAMAPSTRAEPGLADRVTRMSPGWPKAAIWRANKALGSSSAATGASVEVSALSASAASAGRSSSKPLTSCAAKRRASPAEPLPPHTSTLPLSSRLAVMSSTAPAIGAVSSSSASSAARMLSSNWCEMRSMRFMRGRSSAGRQSLACRFSRHRRRRVTR